MTFDEFGILNVTCELKLEHEDKRLMSDTCPDVLIVNDTFESNEVHSSNI